MPDSSLVILIIILILAVGFGVSNGFNDAANAIATVIGTRSLSPRSAIAMAAVLNLAGAVTGTAVAVTIGKGILTQEVIAEFSYIPVIASLGSVIIWAVTATWMGLPVSISHGFIAGLAAAGLALAGPDAVLWGWGSKLTTTLMAVVTAPLLGFAGGFVLMWLLSWIFWKSAPERIRMIFSRGQWITSAFVAYSHGKNDGQMPIGVMVMTIVIYTGNPGLWNELPYGSLWWVVILAALSISLGTAFGGWRVIRTMGTKITTLRPIHGFAAQASAAAVIEIASHLGIPVSTTHCISSSIMGVGATRRFSAVRWGVAGNIVAAWILTFPICAGLGYLFAWLLKFVM
jgi:PiT family inorganic phosphate transporter